MDAASPLSSGQTTEPAPHGRPSAGLAWWTVAVMTLLYTVSLLDRQIIALLVRSIRADLHISDFQMGLLQGVMFAAFYAVFGLGFGWIVDRSSRRWIAFAGVAIWSIATAACGLAHSFGQLMAGRFGVGAGEAALNPAAYSLFADTFPKRRLSLATSVFGAGANLGGGVSLLLGGFLIAAVPAAGLVLPGLGHLHAWRVVMLVAALPGVVLIWLLWTTANPPRRERVAGGVRVADTLAFVRGRWRFFVGHFLAFGLMAAAANGYQAWAPSHLERHFGLSIGQVVSVLSPISIFVGVAGSIISGYVVDLTFVRGRRDAHLVFFMFAGVVQLVGLAGALTADSLPVFIAFGCLFQVAAGFAGVPAAALQLVTPNNYRGQISSAYLFCFNLIGTGVGPTAVGALTTFVFHNDGKVGLAIALNAALCLPVAVAALAWARAPMRRAVEQAAAWAEPETHPAASSTPAALDGI